MSGDENANPDEGRPTKRARATIRTTHPDPALLARAVRPDNTAEMETVVDADAGTVVTRIDRETTGGLHSTADDYVVNLDVAMEATRHAKPTDTGPVSDTDADEHINQHTNDE